MFSKSRINEPGPKAGETDKPKAPEAPVTKPSMDFTAAAPKGKVAASVLSADLTVVGNLRITCKCRVDARNGRRPNCQAPRGECQWIRLSRP